MASAAPKVRSRTGASIFAIVSLLATVPTAAVNAKEPLSFDALARPNSVMLANSVEGAIYLVKDITHASERPQLQRAIAVIGPCPQRVTRSFEVVIQLKGNPPFPVHRVLVSGPYQNADGEYPEALALAPRQMARVFLDCSITRPVEKKP